MTLDLLGVPLGDAFAAEGKGGTSCEKWRGCSSGELGLKGGQSGDKASEVVPKHHQRRKKAPNCGKEGEMAAIPRKRRQNSIKRRFWGFEAPCSDVCVRQRPFGAGLLLTFVRIGAKTDRAIAESG